MNNYQGTFISIEGLDGVGKGTVIDRLKKEFSGFEYTQEPSEGIYGQHLRQELQTDSDPNASDFFMFCADRFDHVHSFIGPKLERGENVLTDRYNLSTFAYQSDIIKNDLGVNNPDKFIEGILNEFVIQPDLTILIDAPASETFERLDGEKEKYEELERLKEVRKKYLKHARKNENVEVVNGLQTEDHVFEECANLIHEI